MKINLIPMAGAGKRFTDAGYVIPKPFIDIDGIPMVVRAALALPKADKYIFVCRSEHLKEIPIQNIITKYISNFEIVVIDKLTEGQAITCLAAKNLINSEDILTIGASDNDMIYSEDKFNLLFENNNLDGLVWSFKGNPAVLQNPLMYGWIKLKDQSHIIEEIKCKEPISENPLHDYAIIGAFTFKKASYFFDAVDKMIFENHKINNEFYIDVAINFCIKNNRIMSNFEVDKYICWGTPKDLNEYNFWLDYFKKRLKI